MSQSNQSLTSLPAPIIYPNRTAGQYIGFAHVYGTSFFNPMSVLGRFNNFSWAFVVELVGAAYLGKIPIEPRSFPLFPCESSRKLAPMQSDSLRSGVPADSLCCCVQP